MINNSLRLVLAMLFACVIAEFIVGHIIGFPVSKPPRVFMQSTQPNFEYITVDAPHSQFWSVEGGNKVFAYNNIGLPGGDVEINDRSKVVFLIGNSFIEAKQLPGDEIASSLLQRAMSSKDAEVKVLNLGSSAQDPYSLWFRCLFFERWYRPDRVILCVESFSRLKQYFAKYSTQLDFNIPKEMGKPIEFKPRKKMYEHVKSKSAFLSLVMPIAISSLGDKRVALPGTQADSSLIMDDDKTLEILKQCITAFHGRYGDRFYFVSIMRDILDDGLLKQYCDNLGIRNSFNPSVMTAANRINGSGHLNELGNKALAAYLTNVLCDQDNIDSHVD